MMLPLRGLGNDLRSNTRPLEFKNLVIVANVVIILASFTTSRAKKSVVLNIPVR